MPVKSASICLFSTMPGFWCRELSPQQSVSAISGGFLQEQTRFTAAELEQKHDAKP
jgi:hypothetical protein